VRLPLLTLAAFVWAGCATTMEAREARGERMVEDADTALREAATDLDGFDPDRAEKQISKARELLANPDAALVPEVGRLTLRLLQADGRLKSVRAEKERLDLARRLAEQRAALQTAEEAIRAALAKLQEGNPDERAVKTAEGAIEKAVDAIAELHRLGASDAKVDAQASATLRLIEVARARVKIAETMIRFLEGPARLLSEAKERLEEGLREPRKSDRRAKLWSEAIEDLRECQDKAEKLFQEDRALSRGAVLFEGKKTAMETVVRRCSSAAAEAEKKLKSERAPRPTSKSKLAAKKRARRRSSLTDSSGDAGRSRRF
jgi:hypothetical protein